VHNAKCYWITGLSGAGKTTFAEMLRNELLSLDQPVLYLDGDDLRGVIKSIGYSRQDRIANGLLYASLCRLVVSQNINVIISVIGLFSEIHEWNRRNIKGYCEIFIDVPIDELVRRDPKGIYKKALSGELQNVAGIDLKVDYPVKPDLHLVWRPERTIQEMGNELFANLIKK
jgi:adenylylsulfate kinase-like enzyme